MSIKKQTVLTVLGHDKPGIIAGVTRILFQEGCNLEDISMTVLEGELAMMMVVCPGKSSQERIEKLVSKMSVSRDLVLFWKTLEKDREKQKKRPVPCHTYLVSVIGRDRTGIVFKVSQVLAGFGINIKDLNSRILGHGSRALYAMVLEADIPKGFKVSKLKKRLTQLAAKLKIEIQLKPFERIEF